MNKCWFIPIALILLLPILLYCYNFKEYEISNSPEHWGVFGDYVGGVYSVVLTGLLFYIGHILNQQEKGSKKLSNAVREIYELTDTINNRKVDIRKVNKLNRLVDMYEYILPKNLYDDLISISDYYKCISNNPELIDVDREENMKKSLKELI